MRQTRALERPTFIILVDVLLLSCRALKPLNRKGMRAAHLTMPFKKIIAFSAALTISGCASIISDSKYPVSITSSPEGASYEIRNQSGHIVQSGTTPDQVTLKAGAGYFDGETYQIAFQKEGYSDRSAVLDSGIDGWYWANILFGGLIGMLAVDPATGAMYTLPETAYAGLSELAPSPLALQAPAAPVAPGGKTKDQLLDELAADTSLPYDEYQRRYKIISRQE